MKINVDPKTIPAVLFLIFALVLLGASVNNNPVSDDSNWTLVASDKATKAQDFALTDVGSGQSVRLSEAVKRTPVVFSFWATYCQYCPNELATVQQMSERYKGRVQFYAINSNDVPRDIKEFAAGHRLTFPMLHDPGHVVANQYGVEGIPHMVVVDQDGKVRLALDGYDPNEDAKMPAMLDQLVKNG